MNIKEVFALLKKDIAKVEKTFKKHIVSEVTLATKISEYILSSGGKRVRPSIMILCSKMCGYSGDDLYELASAIELLHNATLLHDDVIDGASVRRGRKAANVVYGNKATVLAGDFINTKAFRILVMVNNHEILDLFTLATIDLVNGEIFQLVKEKDVKITREDYFYIIKNKTATLMSIAAATGGILAAIEPEKVTALKEFGTNVGMAFQLIDDALDYAADEKELGKAMLADLEEGKITMPLIHILEVGSRSEKSALKKIIVSEEHTKADIKTVYDLIQKYDSIEYAKNIARDFINKAVTRMKHFDDCPEKESLLTITDFIINRRS